MTGPNYESFEDAWQSGCNLASAGYENIGMVESVSIDDPDSFGCTHHEERAPNQ